MTDIYDKDWFLSRVHIVNDCWIWKGAKSGGYGSIHRKDFQGGAHRWAFICLVGRIPDRLTLDHLCRNRACINPAHLDIVTKGINTLRGLGPTAVNSRLEACRQGHPFTSSNTAFTVHGGRVCKTCRRLKSRNDARIRRARAGQALRRHLWLDDGEVRRDAYDFIAGEQPPRD